MALPEAEVLAPAVASQRILIVDDDRSSCEILSKILMLRGYKVDVAYDGPAALKLLQDKVYGLALIDYRMPGMDGVELYRRIREMRPNLVGVFVTGFPTIDTVYPAIAVGVERVIAKPAGSGELLQVIEEFVGKPAVTVSGGRG
jgi:two-component system, NtrC family, response regulator HydG